MIVIKITISRITAAMMTRRVTMIPKLPLPNLLITTPMEKRKAKIVISVIKMV